MGTEGATHALIQTYLGVLPDVSWAVTEPCVVRYDLGKFGPVAELLEQGLRASKNIINKFLG